LEIEILTIIVSGVSEGSRVSGVLQVWSVASAERQRFQGFKELENAERIF